jgi:hypothetical protein
MRESCGDGARRGGEDGARLGSCGMRESCGDGARRGGEDGARLGSCGMRESCGDDVMPGAWFPEWTVVCTTIAMITFFIVVLLQMVAKAFSIQGLNMWVRAEYAQVAVSFLIIFFAFAMVTAGNTVASHITANVAAASGNIPLQNAISSGSLTNPTRIGQAYIGKLLRCEADIYSTIFIYNFFSEFFSKMSIDTTGTEPIGGGWALGGVVSLLHYLNNNILYLALFNYVQYFVLQFSQFTMLQVFLPIGLILRAFPATRGAGGLVTAFSLGFAFVFPICYVLIVAMMPNADAVCSQITVMNKEAKDAHSDPCLNNEGAQMVKYYQLKSEKGRVTGIITFIQESINIFFLQSMFYPLVALIVTFTFIRQTGSLMGADLAEIGRGLMKII